MIWSWTSGLWNGHIYLFSLFYYFIYTLSLLSIIYQLQPRLLTPFGYPEHYTTATLQQKVALPAVGGL